MSFIKDVTNIVGTIGNIAKESYGPLAKLEPKNSDNLTFRYPLDVGDSNLYPHTLEFLCWKPEPVPISQTLAPNENDKVKASGGILPVQVSKSKYGQRYYDAIQKRAEAYGGLRINQNQSINGGRTTDWTRRASLEDIIVMYIPQQSLIETFTNSYDTQSMTEAFGLGGLIVDAGSAIAKANGVWDKIKSLHPLFQQLGTNLAESGGIIKDAGVVNEALLQASGYATNPQLEVMYGGTNMRQFEMQFKMTPRSAKEAAMMRTIVHRFKYHASPEYKYNGGRWIVPPSYFDIYIKYKNAENDRVPMKFSTCVLEGISVDMGTGTDQFVTYRDGTPLEISMMLRFTELEIMHKALREQGY